MADHPVPRSIQNLFTRLSWRWRWRRGLLLGTQFFLLLAAFHLLLYGIDRLSPLDSAALRPVLALAITGAALLGGCFCLALRRAPGEAAWAGFIEAGYPDLAEKLSTLIALPKGGSSHGAAAFVALLRRQTEAAVQRLDRQPLLARLPLRRPLLAATASLLAIAAAAVLLPGYAAFTERLITSWQVESAPAPLASSALAVEPIALAAIPLLTAEPPPYAEQTTATEQALKDEREVTATQFGRLHAGFVFTRAPRKATVVLQPAGPSGRVIDVPLSLDGASSQLDYLPGVCGTFRARLSIEAEGDAEQSLELGAWTILPDAPPRFSAELQIDGLRPGDERIAADDLIMVTTTVEDDLGLDRVDIELRVNDDAPRIVPWQRCAGKTRMAIADLLPLPTGLHDGDRVRFRLRAQDNRRLRRDQLGPVLPAEDLRPQVTLAPAATGREQWLELRVDVHAEPLRARAVAQQREQIQQRVESLRQKLDSERQAAGHLGRVTATEKVLTLEAARRATELRQLHEDITGAMLREAQELRNEPALASLAEELQQLAGIEMAQGAKGLEQLTAPGRTAAERAKDLETVDGALGRALKKLDAVLEHNRVLAQDRLEPLELERLARRQAELEQALHELLARPADQTATAPELARLRAEQEKLEAALETLRKQSRVLRALVDSQPGLDAERLARDARQLADQQRQMGAELADQIERLLAESLPDLLARQAALARDAPESAMPALKQALEALGHGKLDDILQAQRRAEAELKAQAEQMRKASPSAEEGKKMLAALEALLKKQQDLHAGAEKLRSAAAKMADSKQEETLQQRVDKLGAELMRLARADSGAEKDSAALGAGQSVQEALKAMKKAQAMRAQAKTDAARAADAEAALKLEMAGKQMAPGKSTLQQPAPSAAQTLEQGMRQVRQARAQLAAAPSKAQPLMQEAARSLRSAARELAQSLQSTAATGRPSERVPQVGGGPGTASPSRAPVLVGAGAWGELSGELKTRLMQDLRSRYGNDYAEVVRRYFERLAEVAPPTPRAK